MKTTAAKAKTLKIALAGNPNCGKTTLFNALTGSKQRVGNWPGVTVERIEGEYQFNETQVEVTDLPGIYSFSAMSLDEAVSRKHILFDTPDVVVNIVDASNLERNLYLTTQLLEMNVPTVVALNMMDLAKQRGIKIEIDHLAQHLGCPVVPIVAARKKGVDELRTVIEQAAEHPSSCTQVAYDSEMEKLISALEAQITPIADQSGVAPRWMSIKLLEKDELALELLDGHTDVLASVEADINRVEKHVGEETDIIIADGRYGFIHGLARDVVTKDSKIRKTISDSIDKIALNRVLGIPIFFAVMYLVFAITINVGGPFIDFFDGLCGTVFVDGFGQLLTNLNAPDWLNAVLSEGLGGGIQTVSTFIPPIFFIFLCLSFLEDSGYMARAAFVMDRFLRAVGLPGKAFIPMLVGFGCNVPGITATRTLESRRDRILAVMMNPFMSCGARLPVYVLFTSAFFPKSGGTVIFGIYLIGILLAVMTGLLFKNTILKGEVSSFVMELPPYHLPTFSGMMYHTWHRLKGFILRAGKVILVIVAVLGFLNSLGTDGSFGNSDSQNSALAAMSRAITPVFKPMGVREENWPATVGLFTGIFAKEAVVGTLDSIYSQMENQGADATEEAAAEPFDFWGGVRDAFAAIPAGFEGFVDGLKDPLGLSGAVEEIASTNEEDVSVIVDRFGEHGKQAAFAYLLFILIYAPCVAALAAIYREIGLSWMLLAVTYLTSLAWVVSTSFFQIATFSVHPAASAGWLGVCAGIAAVFFITLKTKAKGVKHV